MLKRCGIGKALGGPMCEVVELGEAGLVGGALGISGVDMCGVVFECSNRSPRVRGRSR